MHTSAQHEIGNVGRREHVGIKTHADLGLPLLKHRSNTDIGNAGRVANGVLDVLRLGVYQLTLAVIVQPDERRAFDSVETVGLDENSLLRLGLVIAHDHTGINQRVTKGAGWDAAPALG